LRACNPVYVSYGSRAGSISTLLAATQGTSPPHYVSFQDPGVVALLARGRTEADCRSLKAQACPLQQGCPCL